jgi:peptidyl-prolyl cis-trans isomerase A (cyclophilin A)
MRSAFSRTEQFPRSQRQRRVGPGLRVAALCAMLGGATTLGCTHRTSLFDAGSREYSAVAPDSFDVELVTTRGAIMVRVRRDWSPHGADRYYGLVRAGYFDGAAFFRTIRNFVAQFGLHGDPSVNAAWRGQTIPDDSVKAPNRRGALAFARGGPNTRSVQLFFNTVDNTPRLDTLNGFGFPPIGEVVQGMAVLDSLNWEYSGTRGGQTFPGPSQDSIRLQGNAYLRRRFPRLDYIVTARIVRRW